MAFDVRTLCLGILSMGEATGYEIKKALEEGPFGHFLEASFGAIYPALSRLTEENLVACRTETHPGRPERKIYSMTGAGHRALDAALQASPGPDRFRSEFLFLLLFADHLAPHRLTELIDARLKDYRAKLAEIDRHDDAGLSPGLRFVKGHGRAVYAAAISYIETHRGLLEHQLGGVAAE
ncbi:MAG: PadR family transcriptional regulator [Alphaproteobacteria bacterium]